MDAARPLAGTHCGLTAGERWRGYQIEGPAAAGGANVFEATNIVRMERVLITASLLTKSTAPRRAVWELLTTQLPPKTKIVGCLEAYEAEGWRYEVTNELPATTLREWIACHQAEDWALKRLLEDLSATLAALHSMGIVHLKIRPEAIYLSGEDDKMEIILGGLETAVLYKQSGAVVAEVDPFYAPPEAVDPEGLQPGIGLCAWDWWSVGRVIQEMTLGRHVMSMLFGADVIRNPTPEVCERARSLLLELDPPGMRAGAVESMPALEPPMKTMLRGLLTSARDARWGSEAIQQWLVAKETVSNHYDLARNARFFTWKGRGRTLAEAAQYFRTEEHWTDGEHNLFEPSDPATLANFLSTAPEHSADWQSLQAAYGYADSAEWSGIPAAARRTLATAYAWLVLGPKIPVLLVKGRRVDGAGLAELLKGDQDAVNLEIVKGLMSGPCLSLITPLDPAGAEVLKQVAATGGESLRRAEQHKWVDANDPASRAYLLRLSLETEQVLRKRADRVRTTYALCQDTELAVLLAEQKPAPWANLLLIFTGENPRRFGYITKAEHARQKFVRLQERSRQMRKGLFWLQLKSALLTGRPWSGSLTSFFIFWLGLVVLGATVLGELATTTCLALGLVAMRLLLGWRVRTLVGKCDPAVQLWSWRDGPDRCQIEAQRIQTETQLRSLAELPQQLEETEAAMAALQPVENKGGTGKTPRMAGLWPVFAAAVLVGLMGSIQLLKDLGRRLGYHEHGFLSFELVTKPRPPGGSGFAPDTPEEIATLMQQLRGLDPEMVEKINHGEYEIVKEAFGHTLHGPIRKWAFVPPAVVPPLPLVSHAPATPAQRAYALVSGELLLRPYGRKGVTAIFVVRVPTRNGLGLMVYNAREHKLVDNDALLLSGGLPSESWYSFKRYKVIYLGAPSQMDLDKEYFLSQK